MVYHTQHGSLDILSSLPALFLLSSPGSLLSLNQGEDVGLHSDEAVPLNISAIPGLPSLCVILPAAMTTRGAKRPGASLGMADWRWQQQQQQCPRSGLTGTHVFTWSAGSSLRPFLLPTFILAAPFPSPSSKVPGLLQGIMPHLINNDSKREKQLLS